MGQWEVQRVREASLSWAKRPEDVRNKGLNLSHTPMAGEDLSLYPEVHGAIHALVHSLMMYWMPTVCRAFRCVGWAG